MLRIVIQTCDAAMAANVGGSVYTMLRTFDIENADLEEFLSRDMGRFGHRQVVGIEVVPAQRDGNSK